VNLIFVLANHAAVSFLFEFSLLVLTTRQPLASTHFDPPVNFLDLFLPINIASADRARAFLWLIFHYLEGPDQPSPYDDDDYSRQNPAKICLVDISTRLPVPASEGDRAMSPVLTAFSDTEAPLAQRITKVNGASHAGLALSSGTPPTLQFQTAHT
jgi:hypothetical protein